MHKFPLLSAILSDPEPIFGLQPTGDYWLDWVCILLYMEENNQHFLFKLHRSIESIQTCNVQ